MTLLAAYNFDEASGAVLDASGNGRSFTLTGSTVRTSAGHTAQGLTQNVAEVQLGPALTGLQTADRTLMAWVQETTAATGWVVEMYQTGIGSGAWGILFLSSQWHIQARNAAGLVRATVARPADNLYHHVAGTYDGTNVRLYLDGVLAATTALASPLRTDADVFRFVDTTSSKVTVDDVRIYDTALDAATITTLMGQPVTTGLTLVIQDAAQAQTADNVALTQVHALSIQSADHAQTADNIALTQLHVLTVAGAAHTQTADNINLSTAGTLGVQDAASAQTADLVTLTQVNILAVQDGAHAQTADAVALVVILGVQDAAHAHTSDLLVLTQVHALVAQPADHAHTADNVALGTGLLTDITITIGPTRIGTTTGPTRAGTTIGPTRRDRG